MTKERRAAGAIRSVVNVRVLQLKYVRLLHETLLVPVLLYRSETMIWEKESSKVKAVQMDNLKGLVGVRRMLNTWV